MKVMHHLIFCFLHLFLLGKVLAVLAQDRQWNQPSSSHIVQDKHSADNKFSLAISSDSSHIAMGEIWKDGGDSDVGHVRVFGFNDMSLSWDQLGSSIALHPDEDESTYSWSSSSTLSLSLSADGSRVTIGFKMSDGGNGGVRVFEFDFSSWKDIGDGRNDLFDAAAAGDDDEGKDKDMCSVSLSVDGTQMTISARQRKGTSTGSINSRLGVYGFNDVSSSWMQLHYSSIDAEHVHVHDRDQMKGGLGASSFPLQLATPFDVFLPSHLPSGQPSSAPSTVPSASPSTKPSTMPSWFPSAAPVTSFPTVLGMTNPPSAQPSLWHREAPLISDCQFSGDGRYISVSFDMLTDRAGLEKSHQCSAIFDFKSVSSAMCVWHDHKTVRVFPSGGSLTVTATELVEIGDTIHLINNTIRAQCPSHAVSDDNDCSQWATSENQSCSIRAPLYPIAPVVSISAPFVVAECMEYLLDLTTSTGAGGRQWASFHVSLSTRSGTGYSMSTSQEILDFFKYNYTFFPPLAMSAEPFIEGDFYTFDIELCNFLQQCGNSSTTVQIVTSKKTAVVTIPGSMHKQIQRSEALVLQSSAHVSTCSGDTRTSGMSFSWEILGKNSSRVDIVSTSTDETKFQLPGFQLTAGVTYTITVTVADVASLFGEASYYTVTVEVLPSDLVAVIQGGSSQTWRVGESLTLDGSGSYDVDTGLDAPGANLTHLWTCDHLASSDSSSDVPLPCSFCDQLQSQSSFTSSNLTFTSDFLDFNTILGAQFVMRLNVSGSCGRSVEVSVMVTITAPTSPVLLLLSAPSKVIHQQEVKILTSVKVETAATGVWSCTDNSVDLAAISLVPSLSSDLPSVGTYSLNFVISAQSLAAGFTYQFVLTVGGDVGVAMDIDVLVVEPPRAGEFHVTPSYGMEFQDQFRFSTSLWSGDNLPYFFAFGYLSSSGVSNSSTHLHKLLEVQGRSEATFLRSPKYLPHGKARLNYSLTCGVFAYNSLSAQRSLLQTVRVGKVHQSPEELQSSVAAQLLLAAESQDIDDLRSVVAAGVSMLNEANCSAAPRDCSSRGREECSTTAHTCGPCLSGYVDESLAADGNTQCFLSHVLDSEWDASSFNTTACVNSSQCKITQSCQQGFCVYPGKACPSDCSGHGKCELKLKMWSVVAPEDASNVLETCLVNDFACEAKCLCDDGYRGSGCTETQSDTHVKQQIRLQLIQAFNNSMQYRDSTSITSLSSYAVMVYELGLHPSELMITSCSHLQFMIDMIFKDASAIEIMFADFTNLLTVLDNCDMLYAESFEEGFTDDTLLSSFVSSNQRIRQNFLTLSSTEMVIGEANKEFIGFFSRSVASFTLERDRVELSVPQSSLEQYYTQHKSIVYIEGRDEATLLSAARSQEVTRMVYVQESDNSLRVNGSLFSAHPVNVHYSLLSDDGFTSELFDRQRYLVIVLQSVVPQFYVTSQNSSEWRFVTECSPRNGTMFVNFTCPDGQVITHRCNERYETMVTTCPQYRFIPTCRVLFSSDSSTELPASCDVLAFTKHNVTCNCSFQLSEPTLLSNSVERSRRSISSSSTVELTGTLEVVSVSIETFEFSLTSNTTIDEVTFFEIESSMMVVILFAVLGGIGILSVYDLAKDRYFCGNTVQPAAESTRAQRTGVVLQKQQSARSSMLASHGTTSLDTLGKKQYIFK
jgi:hypothetical protein